MWPIAVFLLIVSGCCRGQQQTITLSDDTPSNEIVAENVLGGATSMTLGSSDGTVTYVLLNSSVSSYFRVNERTGQLVTRRPVDRDKLCVDSGLCCAQNSRLSSLRLPDNGDLGTVCALQLDVAVTVGRRSGTIPSLRRVVIEVKDENDHAPVFVLPNSHPTQYSETSGSIYRKGPGVRVPLLEVNISEAASAGVHRLPLPLATDWDAAPFNVQRYVLDSGQQYSAFSPERVFKLEVQKRELGPAGTPFAAEAPITGVDLLLVAPLDRETRSSYEFKVLAIDGGSPVPLTGTLAVRVRVTDANDHEPRFECPTYEVSVDEGQPPSSENPILKVVAHDADEGSNARILYSWLPDTERFGPDAKFLQMPRHGDHEQPLLTDEVIAARLGAPLSPEQLARLQAIPTYWFRLNRWTGEVFVHRPLDFETRHGFVFNIVATNPEATDGAEEFSSVERSAAKMAEISQSMTTVIINVNNLNDEKPQISIDYVTNSELVKHKQVTENGSPNHFIALIRATDADGGSTKALPGFSLLDDPYSGHITGFHFGNARIGGRARQGQIVSGGGRVTCELGSHSENYTLLRNAQSDPSLGGSEYILQTKTPLDRELEQKQFVLIRCFDDGSPAKTSTATVEVEIADQNDCVPQIKVHSRSHQSNVVSPLPRSRLANILQSSLSDWSVSQRSPFAEHPLVSAYEAGIPVVLVSVPENRQVGTIVASLQGVDPDAGENGRVSFRILTEDLRLPQVVPGPLTQGQWTGKYPEGKIDQNLPPVAIRSDGSSLDLFRLEANGDIVTNRVIDREHSFPLRDEMYLFIEARDAGKPTPLSSYILLAVQIEDENDNPPTFDFTQISFSIRENEPAPQRIGEIVVRDADSGSFLDAFRGNLEPPRVSEVPKHGMTLFINPGHGVPDLPFAIDTTPEGRFFLNVTKLLDREAQSGFQFNVHASDSVGTSHPRHTSTATVMVTVLDVNDNDPEIIFPKPSTAATHLHALSYLEVPDTEILSINANDKDSGGEGGIGKCSFELGPAYSSYSGIDPSRLAKTALQGDLFKLDPDRGLLKTQRRMTEADVGEHWLQLIVTDHGNPPRNKTQIIRLVVDRSPPQYAPSVRARGALSNSRILPSRESPIDQQFHGFGDWNVAEKSISDVVLVVVICLMIAGFLILVGLCFYLRHRQKLFTCLPDVCAFFHKPQVTSGSYSNDDYVVKANKVPVTKVEPPRKVISATSRIWSPLPPTPLPNGEIVVTNSQFLSGGGPCASIASAAARYPVDAMQSDATEFLEPSQAKFYNDCYHVGQGALQSSRFLPIPAGTFKPIMSPGDEFISPKGNFYNPATLGFQPAAISPLHRSRYAEVTMPHPSLYVQPGTNTLSLAPNRQSHSTVIRYPGVTGNQHLQHQHQVLRSRTLATDSVHNKYHHQHQGSCEMLGGLPTTELLPPSKKTAGHYKSEPALTVCDDEGAMSSDLEAMENDADDPSQAFMDGGDRRRAKRSATPPRQLENYAVSFPKPQTSFV